MQIAYKLPSETESLLRRVNEWETWKKSSLSVCHVRAAGSMALSVSYSQRFARYVFSIAFVICKLFAFVQGYVHLV